ncbi:MAG: phage portal protein, partial [Planctomycetota bacterium]
MSTTRSFQKIKRPPRKARAGMLARAIDAAVELVNPAAGARRAFDRMAAARAHDAAERTRGSATRKKIRKSPDRQLAEDLEELREVSRDLVRNDGHAQAVLDKRVEHVVGSTGLHPMPQATAKETGLDPETVREWNEACLSVFQQWATHWADATMHDTFAGLQGLMVRSKDRDGECFIHFVRRPLSETRELGLCLELVEPERIANPDGREDDEKFRQGVELDEFGGAKRYHVLVHHPDSNYTGSGSTETRAIDAFRNGRTNTIHWFDRTEIGQHRGRPLLSSV